MEFCLSSIRSGSEEFIQVFASDNSSILAASFDLSLSWGFVIHGWTDSMFKDPKWILNGRGILFKAQSRHCVKVLIGFLINFNLHLFMFPWFTLKKFCIGGDPPY